MNCLEVVKTYGVMQVMTVPESARPMYRNLCYVVRNRRTGAVLEEFPTLAEAARWAKENRKG